MSAAGEPDPPPAQPREPVVLVHGLWMKGVVMRPLARSLRAQGFAPHCFSYPSVTRALAPNAARLQRFLARIEGPVVHLVGHSLGGLLILQLLQDFPDQRPGRVVTLGTPFGGSWVADRLARSQPGRWLLGRSRERALLGDGPRLPHGRELGVIAGDLNLGVGRLLPRLPRPADGTVSVAETRIDGATDHLVVRATHSTLLLSPAVARAVGRFLRRGRFGLPPAS